jgi:Ca2+:H+ antiporter
MGTAESSPGALGLFKALFSKRPLVNLFMIGLLFFIPITLVAELVHTDPATVFLMAALAIVPLATLLGRATEEYASHKGPALGGFLNATLGNAVELIIAMIAVSAGLFEVVKASLSGSIIANMLLILGMSMIAGGIKRPSLPLHERGTLTSLSLLTVSVIALSLPALFYYVSLSPALVPPGTQAPPPLTPEAELARVQALSLVTAGVMIGVYVLGLVFSLITHRHVFHSGEHIEETEWSTKRALAVMALATGGVALMAEALVGSVEGLRSTLGLSQLFVGVVIVAIVGNAAEHSTAIMVALRGKMDLSFQIAAGSSTQIALLVAPILVFFSFAIGKPMDLVFEIFELFCIAVTVAVAYAVSIDRESNWFEGALLLGVYVIICAVFFFHP